MGSNISYLMPLPMVTCFTSLSPSTIRYNSISGLWSSCRLGQIFGVRHEGRGQPLHLSKSLPAMRYMLAEGPPKSLMCPLK